LLENGYLFLGSSETANYVKAGVEEISGKWKIYRKTSNLAFTREVVKQDASVKKEKAARKKAPETERESVPAGALNQDFQEALVRDLGFTAYYIDQNFEIRQTLGDFNRFLKLPQRQLNLNIVKMVPSELGIPLNIAIRKCIKDNKTIMLKPLVLRDGKRSAVLNVVVKPATTTNGYLFVLIGEDRAETLIYPGKKIPVKEAETEVEYVSELETELNEARGKLQSLNEEMETSNEELQSSNEELLSSNEELQSSNEELQSLNEELHTLNTEHQLKIKELIELNDDLNNYFRSTDIGQVFLDNRLQIRKFNPAVVKLINLIETDIGRPIDHISNNFRDEKLQEEIRGVIRHQEMIEREVQLKNGKSSLMRIMPYIRSDKKADGVVISFVDITVITHLNDLLSGVFNSSMNAIMVFNAQRNEKNIITDFECTMANDMAAKLFSEKESLKGASLKDNIGRLYEIGLFKSFVRVVNTNENLRQELEFGEGKNKRYLDILAVKMGDGIVVTCNDNSEKHASENKLRRNYNELIMARENLKKLNEGLEKKILSRTKELSDSQERFQLIATATNDALWDWDILHDEMWWNNAFYKQMGYAETEKVRSRTFWFNHVRPEDRDQAMQTINRATSGTDDTWQTEYAFEKADGTYAHILDRGYILRDEYGTPYRMLGSMFDTSEIRKAMQMAKSSQNKFRKIFDSQLIGMILFNFDGLIVDANSSFLNMLGYSRQDLKRRKLRWNELTPSAYQKVSNQSITDLKQKGESRAFEKQFIRKDGKRIDVMVGSAALNDDNEANAVAYIIDITDQKRINLKQKDLESRFSFLADFMPDKIWTFDREG
ncbi:MAG: PAS domain S-box protein, partial [Mucilaginibacter polytrichastri]|nr:PAS domain S-box protein [Mucilaginibacter polytrichastri]